MLNLLLFCYFVQDSEIIWRIEISILIKLYNTEKNTIFQKFFIQLSNFLVRIVKVAAEAISDISLHPTTVHGHFTLLRAIFSSQSEQIIGCQPDISDGLKASRSPVFKVAEYGRFMNAPQ